MITFALWLIATFRLIRIADATGATLNSMCICETSKPATEYSWTSLNACARGSNVCRFTTDVNFDSTATPAWVTSREQNLFTRTIERALNGTLYWDLRTGGNWQATMACDYDRTRKMWNDEGCGSVNDGG
jgi:hypothetical protein